jgi:type II secretory pathway component PulM
MRRSLWWFSNSGRSKIRAELRFRTQPASAVEAEAADRLWLNDRHRNRLTAALSRCVKQNVKQQGVSAFRFANNGGLWNIHFAQKKDTRFRTVYVSLRANQRWVGYLLQSVLMGASTRIFSDHLK